MRLLLFFVLWMALWFAGWIAGGVLFPDFEVPAMIGAAIGFFGGAAIAGLVTGFWNVGQPGA